MKPNNKRMNLTNDEQEHLLFDLDVGLAELDITLNQGDFNEDGFKALTKLAVDALILRAQLQADKTLQQTKGE